MGRRGRLDGLTIYGRQFGRDNSVYYGYQPWIRRTCNLRRMIEEDIALWSFYFPKELETQLAKIWINHKAR